MSAREERSNLALLARRSLEGFLRTLRSGIRARVLLWFLFLGLSGYFLWSALSGDRGLFSYLEMKGTLQKLQKENLERFTKNRSLEKEIYLLRHSPSYVEKVAREEYGYLYKGERIFWLPEGSEPSEGETAQADHQPSESP